MRYWNVMDDINFAWLRMQKKKNKIENWFYQSTIKSDDKSMSDVLIFNWLIHFSKIARNFKILTTYELEQLLIFHIFCFNLSIYTKKKKNINFIITKLYLQTPFIWFAIISRCCCSAVLSHWYLMSKLM